MRGRFLWPVFLCILLCHCTSASDVYQFGDRITMHNVPADCTGLVAFDAQSGASFLVWLPDTSLVFSWGSMCAVAQCTFINLLGRRSEAVFTVAALPHVMPLTTVRVAACDYTIADNVNQPCIPHGTEDMYTSHSFVDITLAILVCALSVTLPLVVFLALRTLGAKQWYTVCNTTIAVLIACICFSASIEITLRTQQSRGPASTAHATRAIMGEQTALMSAVHGLTATMAGMQGFVTTLHNTSYGPINAAPIGTALAAAASSSSLSGSTLVSVGVAEAQYIAQQVALQAIYAGAAAWYNTFGADNEWAAARALAIDVIVTDADASIAISVVTVNTLAAGLTQVDICDCASPQAGYCASISGATCICNLGFGGPDCSIAGCDMRHGTLDVTSPTLECASCSSGYTGPFCDIVATCENGTQSLTEAPCDQTWPCTSGWVGIDCSVAVTCVNGSWPTMPTSGPQCAGQVCDVGYGGDNCDEACTCPHGECYTASDTCAQCAPTYTNFPSCDTTITCSTDDGTLNPATGTCSSCSSSFALPNCVACNPGYVGANCDVLVTCNAHGGIAVDQTTGGCTSCYDGYGGDDCTLCPTGTTGPQCSVDVTCNQANAVSGVNTSTGACVACQSGFCAPNCNGWSYELWDLMEPDHCTCLYGGTAPNCCPQSCGDNGSCVGDATTLCACLSTSAGTYFTNQNFIPSPNSGGQPVYYPGSAGGYCTLLCPPGIPVVQDSLVNGLRCACEQAAPGTPYYQTCGIQCGSNLGYSPPSGATCNIAACTCVCPWSNDNGSCNPPYAGATDSQGTPCTDRNNCPLPVTYETGCMGGQQMGCGCCLGIYGCDCSIV